MVVVVWRVENHAAANNVVAEALQLLDALVHVVDKRFRLVDIMENNLKFIRHRIWSPCYRDEYVGCSIALLVPPLVDPVNNPDSGRPDDRSTGHSCWHSCNSELP